MQIGKHLLANNLIVAPMAGVTDRPFRQLCKRFGAGLAVSEMVASDPRLWGTQKSQRRTDHDGEVRPVSAQIAGTDPAMMAQAARYNVDRGAEIIDINMGCPAKKICNAQAGSALLKDEPLVARILDAVVKSVDVPVTLKIRTGWDTARRNAPQVARIAEDSGIQAIAIHGRTRACGFSGQAEYQTISEVKARVGIPVVANGDIDSPEKAKQVLAWTGADGLMIGRAAQGRPWLFREIADYLRTGRRAPDLHATEVHRILRSHLEELYAFYGEQLGVKVARKHIAWYTEGRADARRVRETINGAETPEEQLTTVAAYFGDLAALDERLTYSEEALAA
jgi:tRNA-dihydrouridine synthase B